jgi:type IV fimbrial biogenesis protein FimT
VKFLHAIALPGHRQAQRRFLACARHQNGIFAMRHEASRTRGFTLTELLMSIAILAVLVPMAMPSYAKLIGRTRSQSARSELDTALNLARISAVSHGKHVVACPSEDQQRCLPGIEWHHGWLIFIDLDHDGVRSASEPLIEAAQAQPAGVAILSTSGRLRVDYQPDGSASGTNVTLTVCDHAGGAAGATTLVVNQIGRIRRGVASPDAAAACLAAAR